MKKSRGEELFYWHIQTMRLPLPEREFKFHPKRKWRFDFAWPLRMLAVEIEGGLYMKRGGHNTAKGIQRDMEKYNEAAKLGWRVLRFTTEQATGGIALNEIEYLLRERVS